ncbi:DUF1572 family protein [uncultured Dokdonia sp.]|uniref:DUF1572 family protein n=1 Tax=uncultured Dokdonia sp. TaxID=575653 RepID=UPI002608A370|nr:DUF1572 family protein [uncultured Dokdonia sp.]
MVIDTLQQLYKRDLTRLKKEITSYTKEENLWIVDGAIANSGGNLCLHLLGNLNAFIGAQIGKTGYIRDREFEFAGKNVSIALLARQIDDTIVTVENALALLDNRQLASEYPIKVFKEAMTYEFFLIHLSSHLTYHLGQINYHRRLLDK